MESTRIIDVSSDPGCAEGIEEAKGRLLSGGIVAFPTESFYGLAVNPMDEEAVDRLFTLKQREPDQPILILLPSKESIRNYARVVPPAAQLLMDRFWPGGLTLLFEAMPGMPYRLTAGTGKIGIRLSSHPIATSLARAVNLPVTGTSANISGRLPCRTAMEVYRYFSKDILILDGGETAGGRGSTILDITVDPPVIMREGMIDAAQLKTKGKIEKKDGL